MATSNAASESSPKSTSKRNRSDKDQSNGGELTQARSGPLADVMGRSWASPAGLMRVLMDDFDRFMSGLGVGTSHPRSRGTARGRGLLPLRVPPVTLLERDGELIVRADIPGMSAEQLNVELEEGELIISGERDEEQKAKEGGVYRNERRYGAFRRAISLPAGVEAQGASATFDKGVLEIRMPAQRRKKAHRIEVRQGRREGNGSSNGGR